MKTNNMIFHDANTTIMINDDALSLVQSFAVKDNKKEQCSLITINRYVGSEQENIINVMRFAPLKFTLKILNSYNQSGFISFYAEIVDFSMNMYAKLPNEESVGLLEQTIVIKAHDFNYNKNLDELVKDKVKEDLDYLCKILAQQQKTKTDEQIKEKHKESTNPSHPAAIIDVPNSNK